MNYKYNDSALGTNHCPVQKLRRQTNEEGKCTGFWTGPAMLYFQITNLV